MNKSWIALLGRAMLAFAVLLSSLAVDTTRASALVQGDGYYDDTDPNWVYSGSWLTASSSSFYNGTLHYTSDLTATATFAFSGTGFTLFYTINSNRGTIQVWIDGVPTSNINAGGTLKYQAVYVSPALASGDHTVVIKHGGPAGKYIDVDAILVGTHYDDTDPDWGYSGSWLTASSSSFYNGTLHYTSDVSATATFPFTGTGFAFYYTINTNRGTIQVWIDGSPVTNINAGGNLKYQAVYVSPTLASGDHTVVIKHGGPAGKYIDVDAILSNTAPIINDDLPPGPVTSLNATTGTGPNAIDLNWIAAPDDAGDNGSGPVTAYLVRVSTNPITTETNWDNATPITAGLPTPVAPGGLQVMSVSGLIPQTAYYVAVRGADEADNLGPLVAVGPITSSATSIANDDFATPISIASLPYTGGNDNVTLATTGIDDPTITNCNSSPGLYTLWYTYTPAETGQIQIDTTGSGYDTVVAVWTGTRGNLTAAGCNDDASGSPQSQLNVTLQSGTQYYIEVVQYSQIAGGSGLASAQSETTLVLHVQLPSTPPGGGAGTYDDTDSGWVYAGSWLTASAGGFYNGTLHYTSDLAATATFPFSGTGFTLVYTVNSNRGNFQVWVDGIEMATINAGGNLKYQATYVSPGLAPGAHTVVIKHGGPAGKYIDVDAIMVGTHYDDIDPGWTYGGTWLTASASSFYNGTLHYTSDLTATATFPFSGTGFTFYYTINSNRGTIQVWIDGALTSSINAGGTLKYQAVYISPNLSPGAHTLVIKHGGPGGKYIDVDAIRVR